MLRQEKEIMNGLLAQNAELQIIMGKQTLGSNLVKTINESMNWLVPQMGRFTKIKKYTFKHTGQKLYNSFRLGFEPRPPVPEAAVLPLRQGRRILFDNFQL